MLKPEHFEMVKELRNLLGSVNGALRVEENFTLDYLIVVSDETLVDGAKIVGDTLEQQAGEHGLSLSITVATEADIADARRRLTEGV